MAEIEPAKGRVVGKLELPARREVVGLELDGVEEDRAVGLRHDHRPRAPRTARRLAPVEGREIDRGAEEVGVDDGPRQRAALDRRVDADIDEPVDRAIGAQPQPLAAGFVDLRPQEVAAERLPAAQLLPPADGHGRVLDEDRAVDLEARAVRAATTRCRGRNRPRARAAIR